MAADSSYGLFQVFGVELEYMIVDRETLAVLPVSDELIRDVVGRYASDVENGEIDWSNELVCHVIELKTAVPSPTLDGLAPRFHENVRAVDRVLERRGATLMPTGAHPFMDPFTETRIWPHEHNEIYELYNRVFDCRGHGWSNLQATHLNLPFRGDDEFGRLHAAVRVLLPLLPALAASTPVLDGRLTGLADSRLDAYRHNQDRMPHLVGRVVPEPVFTRADYEERILEPIVRDFSAFDTGGVTSRFFLNSRGAIARFDRGAIEIRVLDIQECPDADLALLSLVVAALRALTEERWSELAEQMAWSEHQLADILDRTIRDGERANVDDPAYLSLFGIGDVTLSAGEVWARLRHDVRDRLPPATEGALDRILERGTLSTRIRQHLGPTPGPETILDVYRELGRCLLENRLLE